MNFQLDAVSRKSSSFASELFFGRWWRAMERRIVTRGVSRPTAAFLGVLWRWKKQVRPRYALIAIHGVWSSPCRADSAPQISERPQMNVLQCQCPDHTLPASTPLTHSAHSDSPRRDAE